MSLVYNPGIQIAGEDYYSFPQPIITWHVEQENTYVEHIIPDSEGAVVTGFQPGPLRIKVQGIITGSSAEQILSSLETLRSMLQAKAFELHRYKGGTTKEYYKGVYCAGFSYDRTNKPLTHIPWSAEFVAADPTVYTS